MPVGFSSFLTNPSSLVLLWGFLFTILRCETHLRAGFSVGEAQSALWVCFLPGLSQEHSLAMKGSSTRLSTAKCPTTKVIIPPFPLLEECFLDCLKFTLINSTLTCQFTAFMNKVESSDVIDGRKYHIVRF